METVTRLRVISQLAGTRPSRIVGFAATRAGADACRSFFNRLERSRNWFHNSLGLTLTVGHYLSARVWGALRPLLRCRLSLLHVRLASTERAEDAAHQIFVRVLEGVGRYMVTGGPASATRPDYRDTPG
jgi:hypothetical protein